MTPTSFQTSPTTLQGYTASIIAQVAFMTLMSGMCSIVLAAIIANSQNHLFYPIVVCSLIGLIIFNILYAIKTHKGYIHENQIEKENNRNIYEEWDKLPETGKVVRCEDSSVKYYKKSSNGVEEILILSLPKYLF